MSAPPHTHTHTSWMVHLSLLAPTLVIRIGPKIFRCCDQTARFPALSGPNKIKRASTVWCRCTKTQCLKENWVSLCYVCNKLALEFLPLCEFHTGAQDKLCNLKLSINLSVKWHRTHGGTPTLKNPSTPLQGRFWFPDRPLSPLPGNVFSLCLITAYASRINSFAQEGKNRGNHYSIIPLTKYRTPIVSLKLVDQLCWF